MVYSGDKLIFGVQMNLDNAVKYVIKYAKKYEKNVYDTIDLDMIQEKDIDEKYDYFNDIIEELNLDIELIKPPCCYFKDDDDDFSKVYLGAILCCNDIVVSRFNISSFDTYEEYKNFYTEGLKNAETELTNNKKKYNEDLTKILPKTQNKPKFYSLPNDCYSCT